jgi:hypothetical protein
MINQLDAKQNQLQNERVRLAREKNGKLHIFLASKSKSAG